MKYPAHKQCVSGVENQLPKRFTIFWLIILFIVAAYLRIQGTDAYYFSPDEAMAVGVASGVDAKTVWHFSFYETHPPLGNFLHYYWMKISDAPWFIRIESFVFGLALIPLYYAIGTLLAGNFNGLCCALIIAFSRGAIIQSAVARSYSFFLFFLSACFYCYLLWRRDRRTIALGCYTVFGCLATATHFSGAFAALCIGTSELVSLARHRAPKKYWITWIGANAVIAFTAGLFYYLWVPVLTHLKSFFSVEHTSFPDRMLFASVHPLGVIMYASPNASSASFLFCIFLAMGIWRRKSLLKQHEFSFLLGLTILAFILGIILFITNIYTPIGGRHNIWVFPFFIALVACIFSDALLFLSEKLTRLYPLPWPTYLFWIALVSAWSMYSPAERFEEGTEYSLTRKEYEAVKSTFSTLDTSDVIVMERDDAVLFTNIYPFLSPHPESGKKNDVSVVSIPYYRTHILFHAGFRRLYEAYMLTELFKEVKNNDMLDGVKRIVFFHSLWPASLIAKLMACPYLDKQLTTFPAHPSPLMQKDIYQARGVLMSVSKEDFINEVLAPDGKAQRCLSSDVGN